MFISSSDEPWEAEGWDAPSELYPPATRLFRQGSTGDAVYLIEEGLVKLTALQPDGQAVILGLLSKGTPLGAITVILEMIYVATAETLTACRARRIPADRFRHLLRTKPAVSWRYHRWCSREMHWSAAQQVALKTLSARQRLEQCLWEMISLLGGNGSAPRVRLHLPLRNWELAQLIGVSPEHLSRMLTHLEKEGTVVREKEWLTVPDRDHIHHGMDL